MKVKNVYDVVRYPQHYVAVLCDGSLAIFAVSPFRIVSESDMIPLAITDIQQIDSSPYRLPDYMLKMYGLYTG